MSLKITKNTVTENLARYEKGVDEGSLAAIDATADKVVADAKDECPVGTPQSTGKKGYVGGSLKKSVRKEKIASPSGNIKRISVRAGGHVTNPNTGRIVDYAVYVHEGTSKMEGRPFLTNALFKNEDTLLKETQKIQGRLR